MKTLRLILGDQLNEAISSLADYQADNDLVLMCEVFEEAQYVKHHQKKIAFIFAAMRQFAKQLQENSYKVTYIELDADENSGTLWGEVQRICKQYRVDRLVITQPGEYRLLKQMQTWSALLDIAVEIREDQRFLCSIDEFKDWSNNRKQLRMEFFLSRNA